MTDMEIETFLTVLRSGSMTAAAQAARNVAGINAARCTHADAEAAIPLLAVGQANLHAFNGARQAGQVLQLGTRHAGRFDLVPGVCAWSLCGCF